MSYFKTGSRMAFMLVGTSLLASMASAQETPVTTGAALENAGEIVVTAKSRAEKLQDVPLSITALTSADLEKNQLRDMRDLQKVTPNLNIFSGSGRNDPSAWAMRGLTANTSDERYQGISFFVDGIALSGQLASVDMDNVERVEVIKGPQSATFGRATYSGAVNFITREPTGDSISASARARGGFMHDAIEANYFFNASLTVPLVQDHLWVSVAGTTMQNGAVSRATDSRQPIGREQTDLVTGTLFWKPDDTLSIRLRGLYTHDRDTIAAQIIEQARDWVQGGVPLQYVPRTNGSPLPTYLPDPDDDWTADKGRAGITRDRYFGALIISKKFGDYELSYRGGYFWNKDYRDTQTFPRATGAGQDPVFGSLVGTPAVNVLAIADSFGIGIEKFENTSHQLVLLSPGNNPFRWRVGGYYFMEKDTNYFPILATGANPSGLASIQKFTNVAGFGGVDWDIASGLTLSAEGRYASEKLSYPACVLCATPNPADAAHTTNSFTPRVTVNYKLTPDNMVYALYSRGVKSGRFSNVPVGTTRAIIYADPEKLDNFEIGSKNAFMGGRLVVNWAGFYNKVTDQQLVSTTPYLFNGTILSVNVTGNVGASEIWGFELENFLKVTKRLTLQGSVGYARQNFTTTDPVAIQPSSAIGFPGAIGTPVILKGKTQGNVPWWNGFAAAEYVVPLDTASLSFRVDASYRGKLYADLANNVEIKPSWTVNGRIGYSIAKVDLSIFGRNLLNNQRATGSGLAGATGTCGFSETNTAVYGTNQQCLYASPPRPREIGVEASFKF